MGDGIDFAALANIDIDDELTTLAPASSLELSAKEASRHEGLVAGWTTFVHGLWR
jgi:hypothetical protein